MSPGGKRHHRTLLICSVACVLLVAGQYLTGERMSDVIGWPYHTLDLRLQDVVARQAKSAPRAPGVIFMADDQASHSLDQLWPDEIASSRALQLMKQRVWSREVYALVLDRLASAGAAAVVFDYIYQAPYEGDAAFREALHKWRGVAVIGSHFEDTRMGAGFNPPTPSILPTSDSPDPRVGFVNFWPDHGVVRRARYRVTREQFDPRIKATAGSRVFESLAARAVQQAGFGDLVPTELSLRPFRFGFKGETLSESQAPPSLYGIFVPSIWESNYASGDFFRGKIVLIGPEGRYNKDLELTPFGTVAGPELHLNAINALLLRQFLRETPLWLDLLVIALAGLLAWIGGRFIRQPVWRIAVILLVAVGCFAGAVAFYNASWILPVLHPLATLLGATFSFSIAEQILDRRERARMRRTLERYVSRDVVKELLDNPQSYLNTLSGVRKNVTVLFSDVRGFTTLTESAKDPHALVEQLNEYFTEMVGIVFAHKGTLDKFIGDAVMAHWGAIVSAGEKTDAQQAVRAALQMRKVLARLNPEWKRCGKLELHIGIGVNHGEVIAGNLGASGEYEKMEITVIGDAVNLASRLEGVTKTYHIDLCIGELVAPYVRDAFILRSLDLIVVKGKTRPVEIFAVVDERAAGTDDPSWLAAHEEAMQLYRSGSFTEASERWRQVLARTPEDGISSVFLERCAALLETPPEGHWTGVFEMKSK